MALPITSGRGFVIAEVEMSFLANGQAVANFPVAFKDRKKVGDEWEDIRNTVYRMTAWGKVAEQIADSVDKLTEVDITFKAYEDEYTKDGETRKSLKATVVSCSPSIPKRDNDGGQGGGNRGGGNRGGGNRGGSFGSNPASSNPSNEWDV